MTLDKPEHNRQAMFTEGGRVTSIPSELTEKPGGEQLDLLLWAEEQAKFKEWQNNKEKEA